MAFIPARAGSKRLPNKNKKELCGKPLICWTIEQALECKFIDQVIVSTDDEDILKICTRYFERYKERLKTLPRPKELALDDSKTVEVISYHCINEYSSDTIIILLQPTSPLRTTIDIYRAMDYFYEHKNCVSGYWIDDKTIKLNGAIYIFKLEQLIFYDSCIVPNPSFYIMPRYRSIDIDTIDDFKKCEEYLQTEYLQTKNI